MRIYDIKSCYTDTLSSIWYEIFTVYFILGTFSLRIFVYVIEMNIFVEHRAFLNERNFCIHSYVEMQNRFTNAYPDMPVLNTSTIKKTIDRFRNYYTLSDLERRVDFEIITR